MRIRPVKPLFFAILAACLTLALWATVIGPLDRLAVSMGKERLKRVLEELAEPWGLSVSYAQASPSIARGLTLRDLRIGAPGGSSLTLRRARLGIDLIQSLVSKRPVWTQGIVLEGLTALIDADADARLFERILEAMRAAGSSDPANLGGARLELRGARVELVSGRFPLLALELKRATLAMDTGEAASALDFTLAGTLEAQDTEGRYGFGRALLPLSLSGRAGLSGELALTGSLAAESDLGSLSALKLRLTHARGLVSLSLESSRSVEAFSASWDSGTGLARLEASFRDFVPLSLFRPRGALSYLEPWFRYPLNGRLSLSSDLSPSGTAGNVQLRGTLPPPVLGREAKLSLDAAGSWDRVEVYSASLTAPGLELGYRGSLSPSSLGAQGLLRARYEIAPGLSASTEAQLFGEGGSWFALAEKVALIAEGGQTAFTEVTASINADDGFSFLLDGALPLASGELSDGAGEPPRLSLDGNLALGKDPYLAARLKLDAFSLSALAPALKALAGQEAAGVLSDISLGGTVSVYSDFSEVSYSSTDTLIVYGPLSPAYALLSFSGNGHSLRIQELNATIGGYGVRASASAEFGPDRALGFGLNMAVRDVPYTFSGAYMDGSLFVSGDYGTSLSLSREGGVVRFMASLEAMPVPLGNSVGLLSMGADGMYASPGDWALSLSRLELDSPSQGPIPDVSLKAYLNQNGGRIDDIRVSDRVSDLSGSVDVVWEEGGARLTGALSGPRSEAYALNARYGPPEIDWGADGPGLSGDKGDTPPSLGRPQLSAELTLSKAPLARLGLPLLEGVMDASVFARDLLGKAEADFSYALNEGRGERGLIAASGSGAYRDRGLYLFGTRASYQGHSLEAASASYDLDTKAAALTADLTLSLGAEIMSASLRAQGQSGADQGEDPFSDYAVSGTVDKLIWMGEESPSWPFSANLAGGRLSAKAGNADEAVLELGAQGELYLSLSPALPLSMNVRGMLLKDSLSVEASDIALDAGLIFPLIGTDEVRAVSGTIHGSLAVRGKLSDPEVEGSLQGRDVYLLVTNYVGEPIGPLDDPFFFTGTTMESDQSGMGCAGATVSASLSAPLRGGLPEAVSIRVRTDGLVPLKTAVLGLDIEGKASTQLALDISEERIGVSGSVNVAQGDVVLTTGLFTELEGEADPNAPPVVLAMDIAFGKSVRVSFPDRRVPLFYGQADPQSRLTIAYDGLSGEFSLKGKATLRGGNVFYIQRSFYLKSASIDFNESSASFDPVVSVNAETRSRNELGPVLILLKADKVRLSALAFTLSSVPSMSEADIARLLGQDLLALDEEGQSDIGRLLVENSDLVPQLNVMSLFERTAQDILGLDVFMVRSLALQRWVYDLSGLGGPEALTLGDYLDDTAITMGKYLGQGLYLQARLRLLESELASAGNLRLDSEFSMEWATPHFLLTWSLAPQNWDTLFVTDQTISLFWSIPLK